MIAALDVGSAKVACLIAEVDAEGAIHVRGVGNRANGGGVSSGAIVDMEMTEKAIRASVDQAEKMAGTTISDVWLTFSGGEPKSTIIEVQVDIAGHAVSEADIDRAVAKAREDVDVEEDNILHMFAAAYGVDGNFGVRAPIGMYGKKLTVALHVVSADSGPLQNLQACVRRAHLGVAGVVLAPFAAGLSTLVEDEAKMGAACIDIGAGTTGISVFAQGALVHAEVLPMGGSMITEQVARALLAPFDQAERLKTFNGAAVVDPADERLEIEVPQVGERGGDSVARMPRSALTSVIQKELELLLATVGDRLDASGFSGVAGRRVVLTGGVAQAEGIRDLASRVLGRQVRIGRPEVIDGLPQAAQASSFSAALGLLIYVVRRPVQDAAKKNKPEKVKGPAGGTFNRLTQWVRNNF
ncbi:cell division protein FtsA [Kordiimonas marina]|uniref:cell division protein FtsA n=1 Tax=Kordiimonas marina TaxID=2872312 RepID=UPI001FF1B17C|nr:cell division protein FtsA [Kordiimonas marina]MCJ9429469.1 cell division protein FtsA [Kordiimonas marina]